MSVSSPARPIKIFLSYAIDSSEDRALFNQLTSHLSNLRYQYPSHEWYDSELSAGSPITQFIEARLNTADLIVLLISADFFASRRCYELEMKRAIARSNAGVARLITVLLRPVDWQTSPLGQYNPFPSDGIPVSSSPDLDAALLEVVRGIRQMIEELAIQATVHEPSSHQHVSIYNPPHTYDDFFTDRDPVLDKILAFFAASTRTRRTPILALSGLGGIGKTSIAQEYSYRSSDRYQTILWLNASSRSVLSAYVSSLADQLSLPEQDREDELRLFAAFKQWLQNQSNWLLVLDQIEHMALIDLIVPLDSNGHVLLTTRTQATGRRAFAVSITSMPIDASALFLLHRAKILLPETPLDQAPTDLVREATAIAQAMDGFPLALDQAGAFIEEKGCSLGTYLTLYQEQRTHLLSERGRLADDHRESVTSTLMLAFEQVTLKDATNLDLLYLLAFLHPDAIPEGLLTNGAMELSQPLQTLAAKPLRLQQALGELRGFSLIQHGADRAILQIHRVVQDVLIAMLTMVQQRHWARQAVRLVNRVFPDVRFDTWTDCERYLPQAQHCATLINRFQLTLKEGALLLERLGTYCSRRAAEAEAETYLMQALHLYENHLHTDSLYAAQTLNSLGLLYYQQAKYPEALEYHQRALKLREQMPGPDHPKTAESLHNLAMVYGDLGEYQRATHLYLRVLSLEERAKGSDHLDVASTLNNLGLMYYHQELYFEAETAYRRALTIYEASLTADHPSLMYPLDGLGALAEKQGHYQQAEDYYQRALSICKHMFGELHPETAHSINKLADIAEARGDDQQAEELYQQALAIGEQVLRPGHPDLALFLSNRAFIANKRGQYQQAEPLYRRALSIYEQALGAEHPDTVRVREKYTSLLAHMDRDE